MVKTARGRDANAPEKTPRGLPMAPLPITFNMIRAVAVLAHTGLYGAKRPSAARGR